MKTMQQKGEDDAGRFQGEQKIIDAWFGVFFMLLLFYAGGCRPCTIAVCKSITHDGSTMLLGGPEKTRRIQRTLYGAQGNLMNRLEPYFNFFGDIKIFVKFHFESVRKWAIMNLRAYADRDSYAGNWGTKLNMLMQDLPTQALFNTRTGESLTAAQMTRNVRHYAKKARLFNDRDIEERETTSVGGKKHRYFWVAKHLRKQLSNRGMRRAIATSIAMDFNAGKIGNKPGGGRMSDEEFLCNLATVFNTSVPVLCNHYIQCRIGTWETDFSAWACIYRDASENIISKSSDEFKVKEPSWDCPMMDEDNDLNECQEESDVLFKVEPDSSDGEDDIEECPYHYATNSSHDPDVHTEDDDLAVRQDEPYEPYESYEPYEYDNNAWNLEKETAVSETSTTSSVQASPSEAKRPKKKRRRKIRKTSETDTQTVKREETIMETPPLRRTKHSPKHELPKKSSLFRKQSVRYSPLKKERLVHTPDTKTNVKKAKKRRLKKEEDEDPFMFV